MEDLSFYDVYRAVDKLRKESPELYEHLLHCCAIKLSSRLISLLCDETDTNISKVQ